MEKGLKELCQFISQLAIFQQTINASKLSLVEVKAMMDMIDIKHKGFLDLDDVYELVGQISETELFDIFKFLDTKRNGQIRTEQLEEAIGDQKLVSKNTTKEYIFPKFYKIVDSVKDKPKIITELKKKYSFDSQVLQQVYEYICKLVQSKYLSSGEMITVFKSQSMKYGIKWINQTQSLIKEMLPGQNISESKFVEVFTRIQAPALKSEQALLNDTPISKFYPPPTKPAAQAYKIEQKSPIKAPTKASPPSNSTNKYQQVIEEKNASIKYKKTNNFMEPAHLDTPSFQNIAVIESSKAKTTDFEKMQGNINSILDNINQRREKLRQDSLERKKLIDGVMQRKKLSCGINNGVGEDWENREQFLRQVNTSSNLKKSTKTYLNPTFNAASAYNPIMPGYSPASYKQKLALREQSLNFGKVDPVDVNNYEEKAISSQLNSSYLAASRKNASQPKCAARQIHNFSDSKYLGKDRNAYECGEISDLMKKYYRGNQELRYKAEEDISLKQLCKSKSGLIYTPQYDKYFDHSPNQGYEGLNRALSRGGHSNSSCKMNISVKQNVLRRAEQQAARKIEEIERKARMKVLEKKNAIGRGQRQEPEWGRLIKRGIHY